ncbi:MAG: FMN-binding negative transcriptional regulator [Tepidisphaeraceae bacterium]
MYIPHAFRNDDLETLHGFMRRYSFATLVTGGCEPFATHLPLLLDASRGPHGTLIGHFARPNPHWQCDHQRNGSLAIFHGPHAYISPSWYPSPAPAVPTWNYATVHAAGRLLVIEDGSYVFDLLEQMVRVYEAHRSRPWTNPLPDDVNEKLIASVVAFEMPIDRLDGKFKLSQNRKREDQDGAIEGLKAAGDPESVALSRFAREKLGVPTTG